MSSPEQPPGSSPDPRPRPAYGEYATPEEQRAAIREPDPYTVEVTRHAHAPTPVSAHAHPARPTTSAARPSRSADRVITVALLVYGFITVLGAAPQLWHFSEFAQAWMALAGIDATFTNIAQGELWGRAGAILFAVGWLVTALLSWLAMQRGRLAWWIPLVGAIVTFVVVSVCLTVPLLGDPAIAGHFG